MIRNLPRSTVASRVATLLALLCPLVGLAPNAQASDGAFRSVDYRAARELAAREGKVVMIDFFTTWCGPCKRLDAVTWPDPWVQAFLLRDTVAIKVDAERDRETASLYEINIYPTILFATPDGAELGRIEGFRPPERFLPAAQFRVSGHVREATEPVEGSARALLLAGDLAWSKKLLAEAAASYGSALDAPGGEDAVLRERIFERMGELSFEFAPVRETLRSRLTAARASAAQPASDPELAARAASDVVQIADLLKGQREVRELFDELSAIEPPTASSRAALEALLPSLFEGMLIARDRARLGKFDGEILRLLVDRETELAALEAEFGDVDEARMMLAALRSSAAARGAQVFEAFLLTDRPERARVVAERVVTLDPTSRGYLALVRHSRSADRPDEALAWAIRGIENLPPEQRTTLEQMRRVLERETAR